jgi:uncharacterized protein (DUF2267 family)
MEEKNHPLQEQEHLDLIYQIRKELSLDNTQEAVKLVASVLQALRQTLNLEQANRLLNMLPDFLKLTFATNWEQNEKQVKVSHLDEFITLVMDRDARYNKGLFRNEVHTLSVVILTLKNLQKLVDLDSLNGISAKLLHELKGLPSEAAA